MSAAQESFKYYWEDFTPGWTVTSAPVRISKEEIIAFAGEYDPQPFHLDEDAARDTLLGGLAASGWHSCALVMRLMCDAYLLEASSMGSPGIDEVRWLKPVRPGDNLRMRCTCLEARASASRPQMGITKMHWEWLSPDGEPVMTMTGTQLFARRPRSEASA